MEGASALTTRILEGLRSVRDPAFCNMLSLTHLDMTQAQLQSIFRALSDNESVGQLIVDVPLTHETVVVLADALRWNSHLGILQLTRNTTLSPKDVESWTLLREACWTAPNLEELYAPIPEDQVALVSGNHNVSSFSFGSSIVAGSTILALAQTLPSLLSLTYLSLTHHNLWDDELELISDAIADHPMLFQVFLHGNAGLSNSCMLRFLDNLEKRNFVITTMTLDGPPEVFRKMQAFLKRNQMYVAQRRARMREALVAFLGVRKRKRFQCGLFQDCPREILKIIAQYAWRMQAWKAKTGKKK